MSPLQQLRLVITNALLDGRRVHVELEDGIVKGFPASPPPHALTIDARGGRLLPGLADHHLHLFAASVGAESVDLSIIEGRDRAGLARALGAAAARGSVRATGLDDAGTSLLDAAALDAICGDVEVRVQYRTGGLWVLNSRALAAVLEGMADVPVCFERDACGYTGRVWRGDDVLRCRSAGGPPSLAKLGVQLARYGVTSVTDANPSTDPAQADAIVAAAGILPQRVTVMSGAAPDAAAIGRRRRPLKILLDDHRLPTPVALGHRIRVAHEADCPVAIHCVTIAELLLAQAAFEAVGARPGDRIEHGMLVPAHLVEPLVEHGLTVVCQPAFLESRGDRYLRDLEAEELACLVPLATLSRAGVRLAAGSDAPYGPLNPWQAIASAVERRTRVGTVIGARESLEPETALRLFLGAAVDPAGPVRCLRPGAVADLIVLRPGAVVGHDLDPVALTVIEGRPVYRAGRPAEFPYDAAATTTLPSQLRGART